jgi:hypothetical protein
VAPCTGILEKYVCGLQVFLMATYRAHRQDLPGNDLSPKLSWFHFGAARSRSHTGGVFLLGRCKASSDTVSHIHAGVHQPCYTIQTYTSSTLNSVTLGTQPSPPTRIVRLASMTMGRIPTPRPATMPIAPTYHTAASICSTLMYTPNIPFLIDICAAMPVNRDAFVFCGSEQSAARTERLRFRAADQRPPTSTLSRSRPRYHASLRGLMRLGIPGIIYHNGGSEGWSIG